MALSRQSLSPTSHLLRNSRLFSLPNPLPRPPVSESFGAGITKASDTATLPYPTHQAIATTKASLARGDWGLKRAIPSRSHIVQTSDPVLRVTQLDTIEHVTDFDSAADHVRTRQKWEEMGVPMMKGMSYMRDQEWGNTPPPGAFEVRDDTTSYDTDMGLDEAGLYLQALKKSMPVERAKTEWHVFNATWAEKWEAKKATWRERGWSNQLADFEAFQKEANKAKKQATQLSQGAPPSMPWYEEFTAFQEEQEAAKNALKQRLSTFTPFTPPPVDPIVHNTRRWKNDGPWVPGMSADDFVAYISKEISGRKKEFNNYLVEFVKNEIYISRRFAASKSDQRPPMDMQEAEKWQAEQEKSWRNITKADINAGIKSLRRETATDPLTSKLVSKLILPFLKLPAMRLKNRNYAVDASSRDFDTYAFDQSTAPLSTHPSAGLGYLRTKSYITNHPILGPQAAPTPIPARVVQARRTSARTEVYARLGVGGFVANDQFKSTDSNFASRAGNRREAKDVETIDVDTPGGKKLLVNPLFGSVTNDGRIHIKLLRSTGPEIAVARGELDDKPPVRENVDEDPLRDLSAGLGRSGVKELDEMSGEAQKFSEFLESQRPQGRASPPKGFPGVGEALRGE